MGEIKEQLLEKLTLEPGTPVSGQALAQSLGVSRNAVWKAVQALRAEGYEIDSATNRGYSLSPQSDVLNAGVIHRALEDQSLPVYVFDQIDSTNTEAKRRIAAGEERFLVVSDAQTLGRGRRGKSFFSPKGTGLYMSLAMRPGTGLEDAVGITTYAAVRVAEAVKAVTGRDCGIKWVNDLYVAQKKVCGILTEAVADLESGGVASIIVGIGINLRPSAVPEELRDIVGFLECDRPVKNALAAQITNSLLRYRAQDKAYMDAYRQLSVVLGRQVRYSVNGQSREGVATAIGDGGELLVRRSDGSGTDTLRAGEISLGSIAGIK